MKSSMYLGASLTLLSALAYAFTASLVKHAGSAINLPVLVFIQSLTCLILILPIMAKTKRHWRTVYPIKHVFRTLFSLGISYFLFYAVRKIPLVNGVLLANTAPLMVPFLGALFFSQKINHRLWVPLAIGFAGILIVLHPGATPINTGSGSALMAGLSMAMSMLFVRQTSDKDNSLTIVFYYFLYSTLISGLVSIFFWQALPTQLWLIAFAIGALFFIVQVALTFALKFIRADIASSLYFSNIIFAAIIAIIFWQTMLSRQLMFGVVVTIIGGLLTIRVATKKKLPAH